MHLILCVDSRDGISFHGRRLSRDKIVCQHILQLCEGKKLWMNSYSQTLFSGAEVYVDEDFLRKAAPGEYCFLENSQLMDCCHRWESVILYCWNREYPASVHFPCNLLSDYHLVSKEEFPGNSHEKITMERYIL